MKKREWRVGEAFAVIMSSGDVVYGVLTHTPKEGGRYQGKSLDKYLSPWTFADKGSQRFEKLARRP